MSFFSEEFFSTSTKSNMEEVDNDGQGQQLWLHSTTQTAYGPTTSSHHDQENNKPVLPAPCNVSINGQPIIKKESNSAEFIHHKAFFDSFPPGYRFRPTNEELILYYLLPKINQQILPPNHIRAVNLYEHSPDKITERYPSEENEWYFFTPRDRKYPNGGRPNRAAGNGFWKATGADVKIKDKGRTIGFKKSLVFQEGKAPNGVKTNWIMHEYRANLDDKPKEKKRINMRLDDYVLCRIHKKNDKSLKGRQNEKVQDAGTTASCAEDNFNNTKGFDSGRLMNSYQDTFMMDASSSPVKFAGVTPLNCGFYSADQNMNMSIQQEDNLANYIPPELDFCYPKYEFEIPLPDLDDFLLPMDDGPSLPH